VGDTESGINRLRCATLQSRACTIRHRHSNYDVITAALGGGIHCPMLLVIRSSPGDELTDLLNSGVSVRPYVHKVFSEFFFLIWYVGRPRPGIRNSMS